MEEPLLFHAGRKASLEWSTTWVKYSPWLPQSQPYMHTGEKTHNNNNTWWFSPETIHFSPQWKSADSEHEVTHTSRDVRQTSLATEGWRALLRFPARKPPGHVTWQGWINPGLTFQVSFDLTKKARKKYIIFTLHQNLLETEQMLTSSQTLYVLASTTKQFS